MATTTWYDVGDARTVTTPSSLGAGGSGCDHLPVGTYSGYNYASHLKFTPNWTGIPSSGSITSAVLYLRTVSYHTALSTNTVRVRRSNSFTEGTAGHPMTATNGGGVVGSSRPSTLDAGVTFSGGTSSGVWKSVNITSQVQAEFGNSAFYLYLDATSGVCEFYARHGSYDPYIVVTYNPNSAPNAPTLNTPASGSIVTDTTPTLNFTPSDPDGDAHTGYTYQVDNNSDFSSPVESTEVNGSFTNGVAINRDVVTTLTPGTTYYWRVKTKDATNGYGPYSASKSFKVHGTITGDWVQPSGNTQRGRLYYTAGSNTTPKFQPSWTFTCPEGHAQSGGTFYVKSSDGLTTLSTQGFSGTSTSLNSTYAVSNLSTYRLDLTVSCTGGASKTYSQRTAITAEWGRGAFKHNVTGATGYSNAAPTYTQPSNSLVVLEYGSSSTGTEPTTWYSAASSVPVNNYLHYRCTLLAWGSATPTSPTLDSIQLNWTEAVATPDYWTLGTNASVDTGQFYFGTQCLKVVNDLVSNRHAYQDITGLQENTDYTLSAWVKTAGGNAEPALRIYPHGSGTTQLATSVSGGTEGIAYSGRLTTNSGTWERVWVRWNTGVRSTCRIYIGTLGTGTSPGSPAPDDGATAWFDGIMLEASTVVNPWSPGFVGEALSLDAGGLQIDASKGGVFRVKTTGGVSLLPSSGGLDVQADQVDQYAAIRFTDQGAARVGLDYGTGSTDDFRLWTATGGAGAETVTTRLQMDAANADLEVGSTTRLLLNNTTDLTTSSTNHAFQIGHDTGQNLRADSNEIISLNNGSVSSLNLNTDGGQVHIAQNANPTTSASALVFGGDSNLYRSSANNLKTDDSLTVGAQLYVAGHPVAFDGADTSTTVSYSVANTWYRVGTGTNCEVSFTPAFVGQKWLLLGHVAYSDNSAVSTLVNDCGLRLDTTSGGTSKEWLQVARSHNAGVANMWTTHNFSRVWVADTTSTLYLHIYLQSSSSGHSATIYSNTGSEYLTSVTAVALP